MADVEAPLANLDGDDWLEFNDCQGLTTLRDFPDGLKSNLSNVERLTETSNGRNYSFKSVDNGNVMETALSPEESLRKCFHKVDHPENLMSEIQVEAQERTVADSEVWKQLSNRLEGVQLINWQESRACQLQETSLNLKETVENIRSLDTLDLSDDEELQQQLDLHGLILSSQSEVQPIKTADEVISEIEEMMDEDSDLEQSTVTIDGPSKTAQIIRMKLKHAMPPGTTMIDCLKSMSTNDLSTLQDELDTTIRDYSEVLVQELALREELTYQKELNNQFISLLLGIQRKRRELDTERKKGKINSKQKEGTNMYLTTVIPYDDHQGAPDADRLQIYIKIMTAIEEDSGTVPTLLTDYILKVLCPKT